MVYISTCSTEDNSTIKDVTYSGFSMQHMRDSIISSVKNFWQCIEVKSNDYKIQEETENINSQREKFLLFIEDSIQQSHEIRKYVSNLQLVIKCFVDLPVSDDNFKELESLLDDTNRNLKSAEILMNQANSVKDEVVKIRNNLNKYKNVVQNNPSNIKSKTKDKLDVVEGEINYSTKAMIAGSTAAGIGALLTMASIALAPFTAGASIAIEAAVVGIIGGSAVASGGAVVAVKEGINRTNKLAKSDDIKKKLEEEKEILTTTIENMEKDLETIGRLIGYWETQASIISDLLNKVNAARDDGKPNNLLIGAIDKSLRELELDELYAKDFCVAVRGLLAEDQARFKG
ncbi:2644_t:CDS:2, partial [Dentiscutata heterogama]